MKLVTDNQIELSEANLIALYAEYKRSGFATIYKAVPGGTVAVSVVANDLHYTDAELETRRNPYAPPEAWAGVL